jgi:hypothetical protein
VFDHLHNSFLDTRFVAGLGIECGNQFVMQLTQFGEEFACFFRIRAGVYRCGLFFIVIFIFIFVSIIAFAGVVRGSR